MVTKNINKTRKILVTVFERNGEHEYNTLVLMEVPKDVHILSMLDEYAKNWYSDPESAEKEDCCEYYLKKRENICFSKLCSCNRRRLSCA